jgi:mono/diheme cytochrome c family protein
LSVENRNSIASGLIAAALCAAPVAAALAAQPAAAPAAAEAAARFDAQIAPLLARHCLVCHGPDAKQGRLDLSRRETALAGGASGRLIVPGKAAESLLWKHVAAERMPPKDRPRLSAQEKRAVPYKSGSTAAPSGPGAPSTPPPT